MKKLLIFLFVSTSVSLMAQNKELTTFFDNGIVKSRYVYTNAQTYSVTNYFLTGKPMETGSFLNGKLDGNWTTYNELGIKTAEAFYDSGFKTGDWKVFDETGSLRYRISYDSNKIVSAINFDSAGRSVAETHVH
jgi:antitoxin component YwqK of YwqJK toxin-antitoxin module